MIGVEYDFENNAWMRSSFFINGLAMKQIVVLSQDEIITRCDAYIFIKCTMNIIIMRNSVTAF